MGWGTAISLLSSISRLVRFGLVWLPGWFPCWYGYVVWRGLSAMVVARPTNPLMTLTLFRASYSVVRAGTMPLYAAAPLCRFTLLSLSLFFFFSSSSSRRAGFIFFMMMILRSVSAQCSAGVETVGLHPTLGFICAHMAKTYCRFVSAL